MFTIRRYPDPFLRERSQPVPQIDDGIRRLAGAMIETMYEHRGVGLAAPQVGEHHRLVIVDFDPEHRDPHVLINPKILKRSRTKETGCEGCLSVPGLEGKVARAATITAQAQDLSGAVQEFRVDGLTARAIQHEIDHLDGVLFIDKLSPAAKLSLRDEIRRLEQAYAAASE